MRHAPCRSAIGLFITGSLAVSGASIAQQEQDPTFQSTQEAAQAATRLPAGQLPAVLKSREVTFIYRSTRTPLACDQLRNRVANVLRAVGARDDIQVDARECDSFLSPDPRSRAGQSGSRVQGTFEPRAGGDLTDPMTSRTADRMSMTRADRYDRGRSQTTPVHIQLMMPTVITPEILDEVQRDKSRRALVSRVQGNQNAVLDDPIYFPAERRDVTLSHDTLELEPMDCELLEQMQRTVFRELDLKVTSSALSCDSDSYIKPRLTVNALLPVGVEMIGERKLREREEKKAAKTKEPSQ